MKRPEIVQRIKEILYQTAPEVKAILFGSEARGDARPDSDIDLLILVDKEKLSLAEEQAITFPLYTIEIETGISISPIVMLKKVWESRPFKTPFYINVMNEGIVL